MTEVMRVSLMIRVTGTLHSSLCVLSCAICDCSARRSKSPTTEVPSARRRQLRWSWRWRCFGINHAIRRNDFQQSYLVDQVCSPRASEANELGSICYPSHIARCC